MYHDVSSCIPVSLHDFYLRCQSACSHGHGACVCTQWWGHVMPVQCCMFCPDNTLPPPVPWHSCWPGTSVTTSAVSTQPSPGNCRSGVTSSVFDTVSSVAAQHVRCTLCTLRRTVTRPLPGPGPMFSAAHLHILYLHIVTHCRPPPPPAATLCLPVISDIADWCSSTMVGVYFSSSTWLLGEDCCQCSAVSVTTTRGGHSVVRSKVSDDGRCGAKWLEILTSAEPFII